MDGSWDERLVKVRRVKSSWRRMQKRVRFFDVRSIFFLDPYENKHTGKLAAIKVCPLNNLKQVKRDGMMVYPEVYVWKDMVRSIRARIFFFSRSLTKSTRSNTGTQKHSSTVQSYAA